MEPSNLTKETTETNGRSDKMEDRSRVESKGPHPTKSSEGRCRQRGVRPAEAPLSRSGRRTSGDHPCRVSEGRTTQPMPPSSPHTSFQSPFRRSLSFPEICVSDLREGAGVPSTVAPRVRAVLEGCRFESKVVPKTETYCSEINIYTRIIR